MKLRLGRNALIVLLVAAAAVTTSSAARAAHKPRLGRCTMAVPATGATIEVRIPDAVDFCELVSQALANELFDAPLMVTPGLLWHYPGTDLSCRLRYRHTSDRIRVHNADSACQWFLGLSPGWHLEAAVAAPLPRLEARAV